MADAPFILYISLDIDLGAYGGFYVDLGCSFRYCYAWVYPLDLALKIWQTRDFMLVQYEILVSVGIYMYQFVSCSSTKNVSEPFFESETTSNC